MIATSYPLQVPSHHPRHHPLLSANEVVAESTVPAAPAPTSALSTVIVPPTLASSSPPSRSPSPKRAFMSKENRVYHGSQETPNGGIGGSFGNKNKRFRPTLENNERHKLVLEPSSCSDTMFAGPGVPHCSGGGGGNNNWLQERENTSVVGRSHGSPRLVKTPLVRSTPSTLWQVTPKENTDPRVEPHSDKKSTCNKQQRQSTLEPIGSERRQHLRHQQQQHLVFNSTVSQKPNMMTIQTTALDPPVLKSKPKLEEPFKPDSELDSSSSELIPNRDSSFTWAGNGPGSTNMGLLTSPLPPSLTSNRQTVSKPIITLPLHHQRRRRPTLLRSNGGHGSSFSGSSCLSSPSSSPSCFNYPNSLSLPELGFPEEQEEESGGGGVFIFDDLSPLISSSSSSFSSSSSPLSSSYTPLDPTTITTTSPTKLSISQYTSLLRTLRSKNPSYPKMPSMLNPLRQRAPYMFQVGVEPNTKNPYCGLSWNFQKPLYCYRKQQHKSFGNGNGIRNGSLKSDRSCRGWNGNGNNNKVSGKGDGDGGVMRSRSACTQSNRNLRETSYISSGDHHHCVPCKRDTLCKRLLIAKYWRMRDQATAAAEDRMQSVPRDVGDSSDEEQDHDHLLLDVDEDGDVRMRGSGYMNDIDLDLDLGGPNDPDVVVDITSSLAEELKRTRTKARARTSMSMSMNATTTTRRPLLKSTHGRDRVVGGGGGGVNVVDIHDRIRRTAEDRHRDRRVFESDRDARIQSWVLHHSRRSSSSNGCVGTTPILEEPIESESESGGEITTILRRAHGDRDGSDVDEAEWVPDSPVIKDIDSFPDGDEEAEVWEMF